MTFAQVTWVSLGWVGIAGATAVSVHACNGEPPVPQNTAPLPGQTLPSAAQNAVGAYLPTARGAGSRVPVTAVEPRRSGADGGLPTSSGPGVPL